MENMQISAGGGAVSPAFENPVAYLGSLGIEAELVAISDDPVAPAAA